MIQKSIKRFGRQLVLSSTACLAALCVLSADPAGRAVRAEDEVVEDAPVKEADPEEEDASSDVDPAEVDGLFEVIGEQAGFDGASDEELEKTEKKERQLIVAYGQVGAQASIHFEMGEKPSLDSLLQRFPTSLDVYFLGEKKPQTLSCSWESYGDDYSSTNLNYYFFTPVFDSSRYEVKGLNLQTESPYIEVIQDAVTYEMIESAPPKVNEAEVFRFCTQKLGLNTAAACGVLANIYCESGFRTNAIGDGGTSVGICQWHNSRWTNLRNFAPDDWQTLEGQLRFMRKELNGGYSATLKYIRGVTDDEQGAYDAAYYWCMHYEMPDRILSRSMTRGYLARNVYWKRYGLGEEETESEAEPGSEETEAETENVKEETEIRREETEVDTKTATEAEQLPETVPEAAVETEAVKTEESTSEPEEAKTEESAVETEEVKEDESDAETEFRETESSEKKMDASYAGTYRCISDDGLNIREERSTEVDVAGFIPFNGVVTVDRADGEWAQVHYDGREGYSKLEFLERIPEEKQTEGTQTEEAGE